MESQTANSSHSVRYQPDERPPRALAVGLGFQAAILTFTPIITLPLVIMQAADQGAAYTSWAIFMAVLISGITTLVQAVRVGRFGAGHILIMGTSASFIAVHVEEQRRNARTRSAVCQLGKAPGRPRPYSISVITKFCLVCCHSKVTVSPRMGKSSTTHSPSAPRRNSAPSVVTRTVARPNSTPST